MLIVRNSCRTGVPVKPRRYYPRMNPAARPTLIAMQPHGNQPRKACNAPIRRRRRINTARRIIRNNQTQLQQGKLRKEFFCFSFFHDAASPERPADAYPNHPQSPVPRRAISGTRPNCSRLRLIRARREAKFMCHLANSADLGGFAKMKDMKCTSRSPISHVSEM